MYNLTNQIANQFSDATERKKYQAAASDFRMPFWDWSRYAARGLQQFPEVFWNSTISQNGPNGVQTIHNPLYSYQFHPLDSNDIAMSPVRLNR